MFSSRIAKFPVAFSRTPVWLSVAFPCLTLLEMARGGLHIASPTSIYCMDAPVVVLSKGFLPVLAMGTGSCSLWVGNFTARLPFQPALPTGLVWSHTWRSRNVLKTKVHSGEMLAMNWQNSCQAWCPGKLCLGRGEFVLLFYFWWSALGHLSPRVCSSGKNLSNQ